VTAQTTGSSWSWHSPACTKRSSWQVLANEGLVNRQDIDRMLEGVPALPGDVCKACGGDQFDSVLPARGLVVLTWFLLGFPIGIPKRRRFCGNCGAPE